VIGSAVGPPVARTLGVGVSYSSGLDTLLEEAGELVGVIEVEPQTIWYQPDPRLGPPTVDELALERLRSFPHPKLLHGIGYAVGGTLPPDPAQLRPFLRTIEALRPPWISEHLSFNRARGPRGVFNTGFLLPPRQTREGIASAVRSIRSMADAIGLPLAVETGVNYLQPRADELDDGRFVAEVVEGADCGLLLDLHNLWVNERNGRQAILDYLAQLPLERVWEVHLAGGSEDQGYWLDSHSDAVPSPLMDLALEVLPRLPNLGALIFELFPEYLPVVGVDLVRSQLESLGELWRATRESSRAPARDGAVRPDAPTRETIALTPTTDGPSPEAWEDALGALVVGHPPAGDAVAGALAADPGTALFRKLLGEFRASMLAGVLKLTMRLLLLGLGEPGVRRLLQGFWAQSPPALFASQEAEAFAAHLQEQDLAVPHLDDVLAFERAVIATLLDGHPRVVTFSHDPLVVLRSLAEARLPQEPRAGAFEVEVTPDDAETLGEYEASALRSVLVAAH
jgi:uncharacterized protein (UPF0276 family)